VFFSLAVKGESASEWENIGTIVLVKKG